MSRFDATITPVISFSGDSEQGSTVLLLDGDGVTTGEFSLRYLGPGDKIRAGESLSKFVFEVFRRSLSGEMFLADERSLVGEGKGDHSLESKVATKPAN